jgi:PAS domain S-box-containing protein
MFLSRNNLPASSADSVEYYEKVHNNLVERTKQLKRANHELANQIAERKRVEEALRQAEQKYRSIFENAVEGIFQTSPDGRYLACNPALARIYGYESADELLKSLTDIGRQLYVDPNRRQEFMERLHACDAVSDFESQVYRKDGTIIWICENARTVRLEDGTLHYYEGFVTDISQRKFAEESLRRKEAQLRTKAEQLEQALTQLQQTQAQLIQNEKMSNLGQLVAGVAHEINNPVNFVCGNLIPATQYVEDLLDLLRLYAKHYPQPEPEIQARAEAIDLEFLIEDFPKTLSSMQLGADRIRQIVQSLRSFSHPDESNMTLVDIHKGIDSTLLIINNRVKPKGDNPGISIIKEYGELPLVKGYTGLLNQVFMNLLCNAIDALEDCPPKPCAAMCFEEHYRALNPDAPTVREPSTLGELSEAIASPPWPVSASDRPKGAAVRREVFAPRDEVQQSVSAASRSPVKQTQALSESYSFSESVAIRDSELAGRASIQEEGNRTTLASPCNTSPTSVLEQEGDSAALVSQTKPLKIIRICTEVIKGDMSDGKTSDPRVVIRIIDNGLGMPEEIRSHIFDPFFTTKPVGKGTGLGLSISYQIVVEKHGGQLQCISAPNQGTEFRIEIPIQQ